MLALFKNPIAYLTTSFVLMLIAVPLISLGTTSGPRGLLLIGLGALGIGALIPPVQRLICGETTPSDSKPEDDDSERRRRSQ